MSPFTPVSKSELALKRPPWERHLGAIETESRRDAAPTKVFETASRHFVSDRDSGGGTTSDEADNAFS